MYYLVVVVFVVIKVVISNMFLINMGVSISVRRQDPGKSSENPEAGRNVDKF